MEGSMGRSKRAQGNGEQEDAHQLRTHVVLTLLGTSHCTF